MPQASLHCKDISYPVTPTKSSPKDSIASLSRCLGRRHMPKTSITQVSPEHFQEEAIDSQSFWSRDATHYFSPTKQDLLRVLKGKNHHPCFPNHSQSSAKDSKKNTAHRVLVRNNTMGTENYTLKKVCKIRRAKIFQDSLQLRQRQRRQNERKFLIKNLRIQKWLDLSKLRLT